MDPEETLQSISQPPSLSNVCRSMSPFSKIIPLGWTLLMYCLLNLWLTYLLLTIIFLIGPQDSKQTTVFLAIATQINKQEPKQECF